MLALNVGFLDLNFAFDIEAKVQQRPLKSFTFLGTCTSQGYLMK